MDTHTLLETITNLQTSSHTLANYLQTRTTSENISDALNDIRIIEIYADWYAVEAKKTLSDEQAEELLARVMESKKELDELQTKIFAI